MSGSTHLLALASFACIASCTSALAPVAHHPPSPCPAASLDVSEWTPIDRQLFSFRLPQGFRTIPVQGIDSWVEEFATSDSSQVVSFDFGGFSSDLSYDPGAYSEYERSTETLGGREATVVVVRLKNASYRPQDGTYAAAATWRNVRDGQHLTLWTWSPEPANLERLLVVLRTVRFPDTP